ncbi:sigma-54-dependent Fis family transcriptional regulator [Vibrio sp. Isolate25]|uniref:sigma-54-dependent Fis family transcriptional regulator n=1 Tax=Vibrio TaxID=662 RepID=UPI001EFDD37D|nr:MULTISPECIES: sigma-54-dependent Fis family transcriptional regulator [Vibrio]MCG9595566.1 sigma-54-dependent Fis family transcriptional regulator [Vibrio sp. Isolate25]USD34282.1 sigma-54-dependent Fis family transcriptional regulator [Vibrio sp. SCSIO 43186]USD47354.1 sigma-54-dependent Fis family transcriptional regulator [Vibrio sp. SCSIO 43145]USD71406.1 sigma-54-dependent Fis family transcriptional regulator [Vibrio sp. SCSIO 43139]USD98318.1 sigma-54-dependent Fis family transcriptio
MRSANQNDLSNALLAISQSLADRTQLAQTLDAVLTAARQMTFSKHGIIYVLDQTGQALIPSIVHHNEQALTSHPWQALSFDQTSQTDPFNYAIQNGEVVLINELYQYNGYDCEAIYETELTLGIKSANLLAWPLVDDSGKTIGLLALFDLSVIDNESALTAFCNMAANSIRQAVWLEEYGYMIKSLSADNAALVRENQHLKKRKQSHYTGPIAESEQMLEVLRRLEKVLTLPVDVLLRGETGAGKEVIAKYIHENSNRADQPLIVQNCAAIPEQLLESELFGHKKGSFTGADKDKVGLFEAAHGGTLFLDEIGDMPLLLQAKLLRVLQERKVRPVGASQEVEVDVRVVAATHCHLMDKIKNGEFRADLFYRLNVFPITLPPLREREADILPLAEHFVKQSASNLGLAQAPGFSAKVQKQLQEYSYPGNVRELKNIVERALLLSDFETISQIELGEAEALVDEPQIAEPIEVEIEPSLIVEDEPEEESTEVIDYSKGLKEAVGEYEKNVILDCLNASNWQIKRVAEQLSLPVSTLSHKMKKYDISTTS